MQTRSPFRRLVASIALTSLVTGTVAPWASAQSAQTDQAPPKATEQPAKPAAPKAAAPKATGSAAPAAPAPATAPAAPAATTNTPAATTAAPAGAPTVAAPEADAAGPDEATRERARTSFQAAQQAYGEGNYQQAYEQFLVAYEAIPSPHAEYWIAKSLDGIGGDRSADAARAYRTFLANPNASHVGEDKVAEAKTRYEALRATLPARLTVTTDPAGAGVTVDGAPAPSPTPLTVELAPGPHKIEVTLDGYEKAALDVALQGGDELEHRIKLQGEKPAAVATPPASVAATPEKVERSMVPAYVTLGLAGAGIAVGTVFGVMALNDKSDFDDNPTTDKADEVERNALISDMAFGVALTLGITGVVLLTSSDDEAEVKQTASKDKLVVAPFITPKAGGAAARFTF
jgi:hypothetical protein